MIFLLKYWKVLAGVAILAALASGLAYWGHVKDSEGYSRSQAEMAVKVAELEARNRDTEDRWAVSSQKADKDYADELKRLESLRNPLPGAPVRVCRQTSEGRGRVPEDTGPLAGPIDPAPATGVVPGAVHDDTDAGPVLRALVKEGDRLSGQVRALLEERQGLL